MDRDFQYTPGSQGDTNRFATHGAAPPIQVTGPVETPQSGTETTPGHHAGKQGNHWMHLLMCAPMLLVVGYLVLAGKAGGGAILYAVGCLAMMGVMMTMMNRGSGNHGSGTDTSRSNTSGHRH